MQGTNRAKSQFLKAWYLYTDTYTESYILYLLHLKNKEQDIKYFPKGYENTQVTY